ncbi:ALI_collapsed_G0025230.mRNA.1.CDS.1 [Saccharomyces cerevisiae]|nr:ALI_collapsed_G0025230.mRNA.1.CDS.1 [Saccharomyces cerevisiae]
MPDSATVPVLGLSNKAGDDDANEDDEEEGRWYKKHQISLIHCPARMSTHGRPIAKTLCYGLKWKSFTDMFCNGFVTASRDKTVKVWRHQLADDYVLEASIKHTKAVTAISVHDSTIRENFDIGGLEKR